ncbi:flavin reductase family protein [Enemella sp. A6]|uniref:flavin reductase family protein n=1 Tax=Enemella sp. A6 TaxID=3440152 RepID=UPI003EBE7B2D
MNQRPHFDPAAFRSVMGHYPTGVAIVTGIATHGEPLALVVGTFSSVSLEPPLVSFMPMKTSSTFAKLAECSSICINVLAADQEQICRTIARRKTNKLEGIDWKPSPSGDPILEGVISWVDARITTNVDAGDHWVTLCSVEALAVENPVAPLLFFQGGYGSFVVPSLISRIDADIADEVQAAVASRDDLEALARSIGCQCTLMKVVNRDELVAVAVAAAPGVSVQPDLGQRLPIIPPIADSWAAHLDEEGRAYWLGKASGAGETQLEIFHRRLDFYREHGFLYRLREQAPDDSLQYLSEATTAYGSQRLTPAQEREIRDTITGAVKPEAYDVKPLDDDARYNLSSLIIQVPDDDGPSDLTLRMTFLPQDVTGATVREWVDKAYAYATELETALV